MLYLVSLLYLEPLIGCPARCAKVDRSSAREKQQNITFFEIGLKIVNILLVNMAEKIWWEKDADSIYRVMALGLWLIGGKTSPSIVIEKLRRTFVSAVLYLISRFKSVLVEHLQDCSLYGV